MKSFWMRVIVAFVQFAAVSLSIPVSPSQVARSDFCQNAPTTIPGSTFDRRSNPNQIYWCAPGSQTYITFTYVANVAGNGLQEMIDQAYSYIVGHVALEGDGLVPDGGFDWDNFGFSLRTWNANNHQMTWGVLGAAAFALMDYMNRYGYGSATFLIYDGVNQVGAGTIE